MAMTGGTDIETLTEALAAAAAKPSQAAARTANPVSQVLETGADTAFAPTKDCPSSFRTSAATSRRLAFRRRGGPQVVPGLATLILDPLVASNTIRQGVTGERNPLRTRPVFRLRHQDQALLLRYYETPLDCLGTDLRRSAGHFVAFRTLHEREQNQLRTCSFKRSTERSHEHPRGRLARQLKQTDIARATECTLRHYNLTPRQLEQTMNQLARTSEPMPQGACPSMRLDPAVKASVARRGTISPHVTARAPC